MKPAKRLPEILTQTRNHSHPKEGGNYRTGIEQHQKETTPDHRKDRGSCERGIDGKKLPPASTKKKPHWEKIEPGSQAAA